MTTMIVACTYEQAVWIARTKKIPPASWALARDTHDLQGLSISGVLSADPATVIDHARRSGTVKYLKAMELYEQLRVMENRDGNRLEIVPTP